MQYTLIELVEELFNLLDSIGDAGGMLDSEEETLAKLKMEWYTYHYATLKEEE